MSKSGKTVWSVKTLVFMGMLIAMEIILERWIAIPIGNINRVSLGKCVVILSGLWLGPVGGAVVGMISDIVGALISGYSIAPLITVSSMMWGIIPALTKPLLKKNGKTMKCVILCVAILINSVVSTMVLTTLGLVTYYGYELAALIPGRLIQFATLTPVYCIVVCILYMTPLTQMAATITEE